eukprot:745625-Hanusia_phi.AAC.1
MIRRSVVGSRNHLAVYGELFITVCRAMRSHQSESAGRAHRDGATVSVAKLNTVWDKSDIHMHILNITVTGRLPHSGSVPYGICKQTQGSLAAR